MTTDWNERIRKLAFSAIGQPILHEGKAIGYCCSKGAIESAIRVALLELCDKGPSEEMLEAGIRAEKYWQQPFDPVYESGVCVDPGISKESADEINAESMGSLRNNFRAMQAVRRKEIGG